MNTLSIVNTLNRGGVAHGVRIDYFPMCLVPPMRYVRALLSTIARFVRVLGPDAGNVKKDK